MTDQKTAILRLIFEEHPGFDIAGDTMIVDIECQLSDFDVGYPRPGAVQTLHMPDGSSVEMLILDVLIKPLPSSDEGRVCSGPPVELALYVHVLAKPTW